MLKVNFNGNACTLAIASALLINMAEGSKESEPTVVTSEKLSALPEEKSVTSEELIFDCLFDDGLTEKDKDVLKQIIDGIADAKKIPEKIRDLGCEYHKKYQQTFRYDPNLDSEENGKAIEKQQDECFLEFLGCAQKALEEQQGALNDLREKTLDILKSKCFSFIDKKYPSWSPEQREAKAMESFNAEKTWIENVDLQRCIRGDSIYRSKEDLFSEAETIFMIHHDMLECGDSTGDYYLKPNPGFIERAKLRNRLIIYALRLAGISRHSIQLMTTSMRNEVIEWFRPEHKAVFNFSSWLDRKYPEHEGRCLYRAPHGLTRLIIELLNHGAKISHFIYSSRYCAIITSSPESEYKEMEQEILNCLKQKCPEVTFQTSIDSKELAELADKNPLPSGTILVRVNLPAIIDAYRHQDFVTYKKINEKLSERVINEELLKKFIRMFHRRKNHWLGSTDVKKAKESNIDIYLERYFTRYDFMEMHLTGEENLTGEKEKIDIVFNDYRGNKVASYTVHYQPETKTKEESFIFEEVKEN